MRAGDRVVGWYVVDEVIGKVELITYARRARREWRGEIARRYSPIANRTATPSGSPRGARSFSGKRATDPVKIDVDIRNISGSTLSSRHVTEGVHRVLQIYERALSHG